MKISTITIGLMLLSSIIKAQTGVGLDAIIVEKYYVANAADATNSVNQSAVVPLIDGQSVTYRVYVDMAAGYKFSLLKGNSNHPLIIKTTTDFFNDPNNGVVLGAQATSTTNVRKNTVMIDSWLTTGGVAAGATTAGAASAGAVSAAAASAAAKYISACRLRRPASSQPKV